MSCSQDASLAHKLTALALNFKYLDILMYVNRPDVTDEDNRIQDTPPEFLLPHYDFIVIGGGTTGNFIYLFFNHKLI